MALAARHATLAGFPDTAAVTAARAALALDPDCVPAWRLLFAELLDLGDSSAARALLVRQPKLDSTEITDLEQAHATRFASAAWIAADTSRDRVMTAVFLGSRWNRFHVVHAGFPALRRAAEEEMPAPMRQQITTMLGLMQHLPALVALGFRDSARALIREAAAALGPGTGPVGSGAQVSALAAWVPPDPTLLPTIDSSAFEAIVTARANVLQRRGQGMLGAGLGPGALGLHRTLWMGGVLAVAAGELRTAGRAAALLDSAARGDSLYAAPLALGLRAEIALARGDSVAAESLLVQALATSVTHAPGRYRWLLAQRYAVTNHPALARQMAHTITMPSRLHRPDDAFYYAPALRLEAEMLQRQGRSDAAAAQYEQFVELRTGADSALQGEVGEIHTRLARIRFEGRDYAGAWRHVHEVQRRGVALPADLLAELRRAMPEPPR